MEFGKTSIILDTFNRAGLRVKYFSASTMDAWTDFVGIPSVKTREDGKEYTALIPPEDFVDNKYDVIFINEFNRAPSKVTNALMELIQFKTINGKPVNIKMVWAAINPHDSQATYQVEPLDPAIEDRFQVKIKLPYKCDLGYFTSKYGIVGKTLVSWWNDQPSSVKDAISPRRLTYAAELYINGGNVSSVLTTGNVEKLIAELASTSHVEILLECIKLNVVSSEAIAILKKNYTATIKKIIVDNLNLFWNYIDKEAIIPATEGKDTTKILSSLYKLSEINEDIKSFLTTMSNQNSGRNLYVRALPDLETLLTTENKALRSSIKIVPIAKARRSIINTIMTNSYSILTASFDMYMTRYTFQIPNYITSLVLYLTAQIRIKRVAM